MVFIIMIRLELGEETKVTFMSLLQLYEHFIKCVFWVLV